ncbi:hypothetical protein ABB37_02406 [Leptomonas pyrrhocoris]|uniref:Uncharacterized protein n=1 Tax=Leptomonas pyrrhocoris TaxID=157538 RepID=A0A0M9G7Y8_LEPPY|nr:hypothetical protein ABB37_02406 [Leptomonas pyrrhocoris]XP_015662872.1 hypothetical protein ABB37_02406 [Leptomonas pyrrhocoris]XP_015662873.1 hypothetical protein ABB37_02406 [Leptomonas pyrrhocoris]KPA84432.1 hypothetical protein ABB37_02406 [Leptomonas pyrrhocoris]KPA84433.1 hypothetical protein ABB37_02406 [Leptomonas pyrrhocoris]KPA84434.1 hypothetical protein ABB37_02406 [Leptomonas pyrrhocoris]|eukprot:XP_015662871.1 hypothetical protein ABB37_02406 [Leptomonas pyrrhocoris]
MSAEVECPTAAAGGGALSVFGKVDCAPFVFATDDDAAVYAAIEEVFSEFQSTPSVEAFVVIQNKLVELAGYPLVTAVLSGRYPCLFSSLERQGEAMGAGAAVPANVAGVNWDLWCRNTWLTNSCAVDDLGVVATSTLPSLDALLRQVERDNDNHVNEVWSVLHILAWALRSSAVAPTLVDPLTQCAALWELIETELVKGGRHTSLQLVLLDLLAALALHASASTELFARLCTVAGSRAQFPHPVHYHNAMRLCYACVICDDDAHTKTQSAVQHLRRAWTTMKAQTSGFPASLRATEWVVGDEAKAHLAIAVQLHRQLTAKAVEVFDLATVKEFHATALQLPVEARAFCLFALPGNALLRLHATLQDEAEADLVTEVVATLVDVVLGQKPTKIADNACDDDHDDVDPSKTDGYVQYCIQQMWMNGLSATLYSLLQRRDPAITAAVVCLLHHLAARSLHGSAARRVLLGSPSLSLVSNVLTGVAEAADVKEELKKADVDDVVEGALCLICALENAELTSVFTDSLVFTVGTLISEGKESTLLLRRGLRALARLASAFPMAGSLVLDFEFLTEQCALPEPPAEASAAMVVGSLDVMSAIVVQQPAAVTFEWIEMLLNIMQRLDGWRNGVAGLDTVLWRCVRYTVETSEDSSEYLFGEEAREVLRNELERVKYGDAHLRQLLPSLLGIAVCMQPFEHAEVNAAMTAVLREVPNTSWTAEMSEGTLRFIVAAACSSSSDADGAESNASPTSDGEPLKGGGMTAQTIATLAERVMYGAHQSGVTVPTTALEEFAHGLEEKGLAMDVTMALFDLVDRVLKPKEDKKKTTVAKNDAKLAHALLPLLHYLLSHCPSARTEATAVSTAHLIKCTAAEGDDKAARLGSPDVIDTALLLVHDACAMSFADADGEAKRARVMQELWPSLAYVTRRAADVHASAGWQRVLSHVYGAAHVLLLGSTTVPFSAGGDPRLDYVGVCGLPHVAIEPCKALVQTVLNFDEARAYLKNKYAAAYLSSLEYMTDPAHNVSGVVPLSLQRYLDEAKQL